MNMSDLNTMDPHEVLGYTRMYGHFYPGDYPVGSRIETARVRGHVVWSYHSAWRGLMYVMQSGKRTVEVAARYVCNPIWEE